MWKSKLSTCLVNLDPKKKKKEEEPVHEILCLGAKSIKMGSVT